MNKNFYSLLSDNWMFTDNSKSILYPYLFQIINGKDILIKNTLPQTTHYFQSVSGLKSSSNTSETLPKHTSVAIINIHHPIFKYDQECGPKGTQSIINMMESWRNEAEIAGVVLNVNSGGGQASGNAEFAEFINNYPKPVEVFTKDIIGSAAYYFSAAAKKITAHKHADFIGCIGSMYHSVNLEGVIKKKGGTINEFYADLSPEKNIQSRELKKGNERPLIEAILNPSAEQFHNDMKIYRPQLTEKALKGDIFSPNNALKEGLIDAIGTLEDVVNSVFETSKTKNKSNTNNSKNNTMSKINVPLIEAVIGDSFSEGETENGIILTDEQATAIENSLSEKDSVIQDAKTKADADNETITSLKSTNTQLTSLIQKALKEAEVENASAMSNEKGIEVLSALVAEYGARDGASTTQTLNTITEEDVDTNMVGDIDISAAMNN
ncbi:S49 family peptidase [Algibacter sp. PT7-4]|uniref:S49 family peptidase n=1 Tax=Algibacter ulvanivorans TaxID=3400999 RepID=UPI003AAB46EF